MYNMYEVSIILYYNSWLNGKGSAHVTQGHRFESLRSQTIPYHDITRPAYDDKCYD